MGGELAPVRNWFNEFARGRSFGTGAVEDG